MSELTAPSRWEGLLRSLTGRVLLGAVVVLTISALGALAAVDFAAERGWDISFWPSFARRLTGWGLWALMLAPLVRGVLWLWARPWPLTLMGGALLLPVAVWAHLEISERALESVDLDRRSLLREARRLPDDERELERPNERGALGPREPPRDARPGDGPDERRPPPEDRWGGRRSRGWDRVMSLAEWVDLLFVLGSGLGLHVWLLTQEERRRLARLQLRASRLETELAGARLDRLTAQLQPHFLFNALHAVGGLVREDRRPEALATLSAVGDLLRASLDPRAGQTVPVDTELAALHGFLSIATIRLGERLVTQVTVEPGCGEARLPSLMLLPLVENAVIHGAEPRVDPTTITIAVSRRGPRLEVVVEDDGPGFPDEVLASGRGADTDRPHVGLANTRSRLRTLYGDEASLTLGQRVGGGARVTLSVPWTTEDEERADD